MRAHPKSTYFGVNQVGISTSYGVAGRLGEVRGRFATYHDAWRDCRRLNRAYALGERHALLRIHRKIGIPEGRSGTARKAPSTDSGTTAETPDVGVQPAAPLIPPPERAQTI